MNDAWHLLRHAMTKNIFNVLLFLMPAVMLWPVEILHDTVRTAAPGVNLPIEFTPAEINKIVRATLYTRTARTGAYLSFPMSGSGRLYRGEIP